MQEKLFKLERKGIDHGFIDRIVEFWLMNKEEKFPCLIGHDEELGLYMLGTGGQGPFLICAEKEEEWRKRNSI